MADQDRLVHQPGHQLEHLVAVDAVARAHGFGRLQVEPAGEHRHSRPQRLLGLRAQLVAASRPPPSASDARRCHSPAAPAQQPERSSSRCRICSGDSTRNRAAASSIASGSPSRRRQIRPIVPWLPAVTVNPGRTSVARAGEQPDRLVLYRLPGPRQVFGSVTGNGATATMCSPGTPSACRLVARTRSPGTAASRSATTPAHRSTRCSQLSSTRSSCLSARWLITTLRAGRVDRSRRPSASATVCSSNARSCNAASSTSHTPSANARRTPAATRSASRVLPTPPTPVNVTRRAVDSTLLASEISPRRPTKLVSSAGRLSLRRVDTAPADEYRTVLVPHVVYLSSP